MSHNTSGISYDPVAKVCYRTLAFWDFLDTG